MRKPGGEASERVYGAALIGQVLAFFGGFLGAVHALAHGSALRAGLAVLAAVAIIVACARLRGIVRRRVRARIVERVDDPLLGAITYADGSDWWVASITVQGRRLEFAIGGDTAPAPALLSHARDIVRSSTAFEVKVRAFLRREAERMPEVGDEIRALEIEQVCLFWPDRPEDGMIYFRGAEGQNTARVWRCDYVAREPDRIGFDS